MVLYRDALAPADGTNRFRVLTRRGSLSAAE
jgi:hypothetical protein